MRFTWNNAGAQVSNLFQDSDKRVWNSISYQIIQSKHTDKNAYLADVVWLDSLCKYLKQNQKPKNQKVCWSTREKTRLKSHQYFAESQETGIMEINHLYRTLRWCYLWNKYIKYSTERYPAFSYFLFFGSENILLLKQLSSVLWHSFCHAECQNNSLLVKNCCPQPKINSMFSSLWGRTRVSLLSHCNQTTQVMFRGRLRPPVSGIVGPLHQSVIAVFIWPRERDQEWTELKISEQNRYFWFVWYWAWF